MRITIVLLSMAFLTLSAAAAEPDYDWDFDSDSLISQGAEKRKVTRADLAPGQGIDGSIGLSCGPESRNYIARFSDLNIRQLTFELKFKLTAALDSKRPATLLSYAVHSYYRRQFTLQLEPDGKITAWFEVRDDKDPKQVLHSVKLTGDSLEFQTNRWYTLRVASEADGPLRLWLDGRFYAGVDKALGFSDLEGHTPEAYPFLALGSNLYVSPSTVSRPFVGVIDDLKIWKSIEEPSPLSQTTSEEVSRRDPNLLVTEAGQKEWTTPFSVYDRETAVLGAFEKVDQKFHDHAARASLHLEGDTLVVTFQCPIPPGATLDTQAKVAWQGDCVEFFIKPSDQQHDYYQYAVNANGKMEAFRYQGEGNRDSQWSTHAVATVDRSQDQYTVKLAIPLADMELDASDLDDASRRITGNFTRSGPTAGGQSSWAPVGANFHHFGAFGQFVFGSRQAYFQHRLSQLDERLNTFDNSELKQKANRQSAQIAEAIEQHGNNPGAWDRLSDALYNQELTLVQLSLNDRLYLIQGRAAWDNNLALSSTARPLESITIQAARNDKLIYGFTFTNLTDQSFMGQLKFVANLDQIHRFNRQPSHPLDRRLKLLEGLAVQDRNGQSSYDPLAPLPMGTLVRAGGKATVPLWLEVDTHDLPAGTYAGYLYLKSSQPDFPDEAIPFELNVADVDLAAVKVDSFNYNYMPDEQYEALVRYEMNWLYAGTPGQDNLNIYPLYDERGNVLHTDFSDLDQKIQAYQKAGVAADEMKVVLYMAVNLPWATRRDGKVQFKVWTPEWEKAVHGFLTTLTAHLHEQYGLTEEQLILYPVDEPHGDIDTPDTLTNQAYRFARLVKATHPRVSLMVNPALRDDAQAAKNLNKLAEVYDIFILYRPRTTPRIIAWAQAIEREIGTYHILQRSNGPSFYRRMAWQNLRDGFSGVMAYWHFDSMAGGDGFNAHDTYPNKSNSADYGTMYIDFNQQTFLSSRRQEAWYRGFLDYKLATFCRNQIAQGHASAEDEAELERIIATGVAGDMEVMDQMRVALLRLAVKLSR